MERAPPETGVLTRHTYQWLCIAIPVALPTVIAMADSPNAATDPMLILEAVRFRMTTTSATSTRRADVGPGLNMSERVVRCKVARGEIDGAIEFRTKAANAWMPTAGLARFAEGVLLQAGLTDRSDPAP